MQTEDKTKHIEHKLKTQSFCLARNTLANVTGTSFFLPFFNASKPNLKFFGQILHIDLEA